MATAGRKALVKVSGSAVAFTDEATTANGDRTRYQLTNTVKRVWDRTVAIVVERDPTGGSGFSVVPASEYTLNRLLGTVIFGTAQGAAVVIRVDGSYLPMSTAAEGKSYSYTLSAADLEDTKFGDTYITRKQGHKTIAGSIGSWRTTDTYFETQLTSGNPVVLEFFSDSSIDADVKIWAILNSQQIQAVVDGLVDQTVEFQGTPDIDGRLVSWDATAGGGGGSGWVTSGLIHMWHPSAGSGQTVADTVGTVPLQLGPTSGADAEDPTWEASPPVLLMDGTNDYAENVTPNFVGDLTAFSFEGVMRLSALPVSAGSFLSFYDADEAADKSTVRLVIYSDGSVQGSLRDAGDVSRDANSAPGGPLTAGTRFHVVMTWDGTTVRVWINKVDVANVACASIYAPAGVNNVFCIGRNRDPSQATVAHRHGTWRIYNRALNGTEITQNYTDRKTIYTDLP